MQIYRCFLFMLLTTICVAAFPQNKNIVVKGIVSETDATPVMYASVALMRNNAIVTGALTDSLGAFCLNGKLSGAFTLRISSVGYSTVTKDVNISPEKKEVNLGRFKLSQTATALGEAVVKAKAAQKIVTAEKTTINTSSSVATATGSILEIIRNSSAVSVDGDENVSIRGNGNVLILVDGVPTTLSGLSGIPASNVQSIDIITSPDAKYDAEGTGGIINIVSRKQVTNCLNALASANYGFNGFVNGNVAINYNKGKWGFRLNYNGKYEKDEIESELHRMIRQTGNCLDQYISATNKNWNNNIGANVSFKPSSKDVFMLDVKLAYPRMNNFQYFTNHYMTGGNETDKLRQTDISFNREMAEGAMNYKHVFVPNKQEMSIMASFSQIHGHRPSYYYERDEMVQRSVSGGNPQNATLQLDFMKMLGKTRLETGAKMTYRKNNIDHKMFLHDTSADEWSLSPSLSNDLRHREYIPALYAMAGAKLTSRLTYKAGLRLEYSHVTLNSNTEHLDDATDNYFLAPNVTLNYKASEPLSFTFGLSRRISRPTYPQLNPYINLIDDQTYETGNVRLNPEKTNKIDLGYAYKNKRLTLNGNAYFNYTQDYITQIAYISPEALVMTYINSDRDIKVGLEHNLKLNVLKWLGAELSSNLYYTNSKGTFDGADINNHGFVTNNNISLNFKPAKGMTIQTQYFVTTPQYFPQFTTKTIHYCNIGVRQSLMKGCLTLSALMTDVFNTRRWDISSDNAIYTLANKSKNKTQMFWLGVTWNFNSFKPLNTPKKQADNRSVIKLGE